MYLLRTNGIVVLVVFAALCGKSLGQLRRLPTIKPIKVQLVSYEQRETGPSPNELSASSRFLTQTVFQTKKDGLTLADLEQIAEQNHPTLAAAAALVEAKEGRRLQVGLMPNPIIGYVANEMGGGSAGQQGGFIKRQFITGGKLRLNRAVVYEEVQKARNELAAQRMRLRTDVKISYYKTLAAQRRYDLAKNLLKISERAVIASDALYQAKQSSLIELLQARTESGTALIMLQNTRNRHWQAWRELAAVLGQPAMKIQKLTGNLEAAAPELNWHTAYDQLIAGSPQIAVARTEVNKARWAIQRAHAQVIPNINVQLSVQHDNSNSYAITNVQAGFPLPIFNRNQGGIFQAESELIAKQRQVERLELQLQNQLAAVFRRYSNARYNIEDYSTKILPNTQKTLDLVTTGYESGEFGFLNFLTAQRTFFKHIWPTSTRWNNSGRLSLKSKDFCLQDPCKTPAPSSLLEEVGC